MSARFSLEYYNGIPRIFDAHEESYYIITDSYLLALLNVMDRESAALREEVERLRVRVEVLGAMLYEINSMNDTANLNDAELWNVNGETQNRIDVLLKSVDLKGE